MPWVLAVLSLPVLLMSCTNGERRSSSPASSSDPATPPMPGPPAPPQLRLVAITDLQGYLEPCGCQKTPLGGIDRAAAQIDALRRDGVPTVVLTVGDLLFEATGAHGEHPEGGDTQEIWKAEVLADVLKRLGVGASVLGTADERFGTELRAKLIERAALRVLEGDGEGATATLGPGGISVGVWGATLAADDADLSAAAARASERAQALRAKGAQLVLGLVDGDARNVSRLAGRVAGTDLIINGGLRREQPQPPATFGKVSVLGSGQHGRGLLVVDLYLEGDGPLADASPWTRDVQREAREVTIADLGKRIAEWEKQPGVDPQQLARQRARMERLRGEVAALSKADGTSGRRFAARYIELSPEVAKDDATTQVMVGYDRRVNAHNRSAFADHRPPPAAKGTAHYVGADACGSCHASALAWWKQHPHGNAYATLQVRHKEFNLSCVGCHVTGYERPGGSTVTHNEGLTNVGCESCHGAGSMHMGDRQHITRAPEASVCVKCHNAEHSDHFDFELYRSQLIVEGHGKPPATPAAPK